MDKPETNSQFLFSQSFLPVTFKVRRFEYESSLSKPYRCVVEIFCTDDTVLADSLLMQTGCLTVINSKCVSHIHGIITKLECSGFSGSLEHYSVTLEPALSLLDMGINFRIFQQKNVPDIVRQILNEAHMSEQDYSFRLSETYLKRDYCTQYNETNADFFHRLLTEEGLFYFFEHSVNGSLLVVTDTNNYCKEIANQSVLYRQPTGVSPQCVHIYSLRNQKLWGNASVELGSFNFENPTSTLASENSEFNRHSYNNYEYDGSFKNRDCGNRLATIQAQAQDVTSALWFGSTNCTEFHPGYKFSVTNHLALGDKDQLLLLSVQWVGSQPQELGANSPDSGYSLQVNFTGLPAEKPYRSSGAQLKNAVDGLQTAWVTGPQDEEIYTDQFGRVKVQFHWDREGKYDQDSSCWLRVRQAAAGSQWGSLLVPRIGQEVLIGFIDGHPDRPIVVGSIYNGANQPPYSLPANQNRIVFKTVSTPYSPGFNELRIDDSTGAEQVFIHAQRDIELGVERDWRQWVGGDCHRSINNNLNQRYDQDLYSNVATDYIRSVGLDYHHRVDGCLNYIRGGSDFRSIGGDLSLTAGCEIVAETSIEITLKVGSSLLKIDPSGITILGPTVSFNSGGAPIAPTS